MRLRAPALCELDASAIAMMSATTQMAIMLTVRTAMPGLMPSPER